MIAFAIAVKIGLPQPYWALVTCCVVMNPITGAIRSKAIYRFMGTLGAGVVSLVLAAIFVNTPVLLIAVMGLAATATLAVSLIDRTPRSYGFLLFGVTMMLVAVPEINSPGNLRSEERRVGKGCSRPLRSRGVQYNVKKKINTTN